MYGLIKIEGYDPLCQLLQKHNYHPPIWGYMAPNRLRNGEVTVQLWYADNTPLLHILDPTLSELKREKWINTINIFNLEQPIEVHGIRFDHILSNVGIFNPKILQNIYWQTWFNPAEYDPSIEGILFQSPTYRKMYQRYCIPVRTLQVMRDCICRIGDLNINTKNLIECYNALAKQANLEPIKYDNVVILNSKFGLENLNSMNYRQLWDVYVSITSQGTEERVKYADIERYLLQALNNHPDRINFDNK